MNKETVRRLIVAQLDEARLNQERAAALARDVIAGGAPGVHLYAFNSHETVLAVLRDAGILTHPLEKEVAR